MLTNLQERKEVLSETFFNAFVLKGLPISCERFVIQDIFNQTTNFTELRSRLKNFHGSTAHRHKDQVCSVEKAVKRDFRDQIEETALLAGSLDSLPKISGGTRQRNAGSKCG